jgi:hypothetical protein
VAGKLFQIVFNLFPAAGNLFQSVFNLFPVAMV